MSSSILRPRVVSFLKKLNSYRHQRALCSNFSANTPKQAVVDPVPSASSAAQTVSKETPTSNPSASSTPSPPPPPPPSPPPSAASGRDANSRSKAWNFLKYSLIGLITSATATVGYVSHAYNLDEVDEKTKSLREAAKYRPNVDASSVDKFQCFLYSAAMAVPAKAIDAYLDARRLIEEQIQSYTEPYSDKLLPDLLPQERHVFTLVLDLNETLIHYIWSRDTGWQTFKRPGVDAFLEHLAQFYEIIVYTDEQNMFVDPVIDRLDTKHCIRYRLSRPATKYQNGKHYRDITKLNRDPAKVLYLSGHAFESCLQPENCVPIKPWQQTDVNDTTLLDFIPFLEFVARTSPSDIRPVLASYRGSDIPTEFIRRSKEHKKRMQEQKQRRSLWRQ